MALSDGDAFSSGDIFAYQQAERMKVNWRAASVYSSPESGMLFSNSSNEKLSHYQAAAWKEILQGGTQFDAKVVIGAFASPIDVTATRKYGIEAHYSGNDYDVVAFRARAHLITTDTTATSRGGEIQAANADGIDAGVVEGALIEAIGKSSATQSTISMMRGLLVGAEWSAKDIITDLRTLHVRTHTRDAATEGYVSGTSYAILVENEAVGGNGQPLDAGIYFSEINISGGRNAFTYGIDFTDIVGKLATAELRLSNGETIDNLTNGIVAISGTLESPGLYASGTTLLLQNDAAQDIKAFAGAGVGENPFVYIYGDFGGVQNFFRVNVRADGYSYLEAESGWVMISKTVPIYVVDATFAVPFLEFYDNIIVYFGTSEDGSIEYDETTNDAWVFGIPVSSRRGLIFCDVADIAADFTGLLGVITNPRVAMLDSDADSYMAFDWSTDDAPRILLGGNATNLQTNAIMEYTRQGNLFQWTYQADLADDATFNLPAFTDGCWGFIQAGNNEEYAIFAVDNDGDVTLIQNSANVVAGADTDGKLCIGTAGTQEPLVIKNRLAAQKNINLIIWYS